ncbi:COQ9 family protein [Sulfitobacter guttiformis]|uniref:Ubiquinone biosynthesis protein COQ9 n=1 Tax=Sulfitobacter guttiformis TaxID=74349 RepID=A0A420DQY3_9RHOB|nr:COQ9 family protein [Sulfitobacter guttiformis]KIN74044.1 RpsU-divergently transcribed protein [Sulfitobacter guttiformis KCTC 32187]RKE96665.1 ubiquinone biosynthesis protein COQ9 [Sulfitobacter guttiformis]
MPTTRLTPKDHLLQAAQMHVPFDGWSQATFDAAIADSGVDRTVAQSLCPRGAVDLAVLYHQKGDKAMLAKMAEADLSTLKYSARVAAAVRFRLEAVEDKEIVRRGTTLFALPIYAGDAAKLIWGTADAIWTALGDTSEDVNWYTKRATLSGVYSATVLYWLGDTSADHADTWSFLDRRIENVMQIEKLKAQVNSNPVLSKLMAGPNWLLGHVKAPQRMPQSGMPGRWTRS